MDVIRTKIDVKSPEYQDNYSQMTALVEELNRELDTAMNDRSPKSLARHEESGKMPAAQKLDLLLDRNTPFLEVAPLAARGLYDGKIHKAGLICGIGMVGG
ncbi:MAG: hypothetical protein MI749_15780, partial [Desulfovibrionales bacterium]|nr:hypothetical protein [Desulfovibrionales bacterium]